MASAVATPLERRFGRIAGITEMTSTSSLGIDQHHAAVRPRPRRRLAPRATCRPRSTPPAASCRRTCRRRPNYRKVNPADAPILILSLTLEDAAAGAGLRRRQHRPRAEDLAGRRASGRCSSAAAQQPAVRVQADPAALRRRRADAGGRARGARRAHRRISPRARVAGARRRTAHRRQRSALRRRRTGSRLIISYQNGARGAPRRRRARHRRRRERARRRLVRRQARGAADHPPPAGRQHHRGHRARQGAAARSSAHSISPAIDVHDRARPQRRPSAPRSPTSR